MSLPTSWLTLRGLRGACIGFAVLGHLLTAIPVPARVSQTVMQTKPRQRDVDMWVSGLGLFGVRPKRASIENGIIWFTNGAADLDRAVRAPWRPILRSTRTGQSWALFSGTSNRHDRLVIQVFEDGNWRDVYRRQDVQADWRDSVFRFRRVRGVYDVSEDKYTKGYRHFSKWILHQALGDYPHANRARMFLERATVPTPWEPDVAPEPKRRLIQLAHREDLEGGDP